MPELFAVFRFRRVLIFAETQILKEALHKMPFFVQAIINFPRFLCVALGRNHRLCTMLFDVCKNFLCAIGLIAQQIAARNLSFFHQLNGVCRIMIITTRKEKSNRIPQPIYNCMDFCVKTTFCASNSLILCFFPHR